MAIKEQKNTKKLSTFHNIKPHEKLAIQLRSEGRTYEQVTNTINSEYDLGYKQQSVRAWFIPGGKLEQAYYEFNDEIAKESLKRAKMKLKKAAESAVDTLLELTGNEHEGGVRVRAASRILNKYIPDRQVILDAESEDKLPDSLSEAGDKVVEDLKPIQKPPKDENLDEPGNSETPDK